MLSNSNAFSPPSESGVSSEFIPASVDSSQRVDTHYREPATCLTGCTLAIVGLRYGFDDPIGMLDASDLIPAGGSRKYALSPSSSMEFSFLVRCYS